ncbi:B-type cyclin [Vermiconidia calcicola]|uniref:B-type cyclin n=1 Tax=Vermiconidia calcicola TaxID=1690605 RepID=A0ACC3MNC4_9PEZI|nr:B-type cyclin [Vermiconidia calcicola]
MDAKPQRPRLRVHDENMPPPALPGALPGKTLHQRTKSTPAFSTLLQAGAVKAANKKVLGEANVNARILQTARDDSEVGKASPGKIILQEPVKPAAAATFARPATRPLATKTASAQNVPTAVAPTTAKPTTIAQTTQPEPEPVKKVIARKSMKVLKEVQPAQQQQLLPELDLERPAPVAPVHQALTTVKQPIQSVLPTQATIEKQVQSTVPYQRQEIRKTESVPLRDEAAYRPQPKAVPVSVPSLPPGFTSEQEYMSYLEYHATQYQLQQSFNGVHVNGQAPYLSNAQPLPEQYYEIDEEEYGYDDGYTTARSFGLHGESTGGVTTVLAPKLTDKVEKEIQIAKEHVEATRPAEDVEDEQWDTSMVAEYGDEIFSYMRDLENRMAPNPRYMEQQTEIQWSMRAVLMDWVIQVHQRFNLLPETLFLTVNYIDRFLSCKIVSLGKLQLVGATAIFVAAKYEEVQCPTISEIIYMVDGGYSADELLKAERFMLSMLQFELGWPGPMSFLRRISKADDYDLETRTLAKYFLEVTIMDERFVGCTPSFLAAGAHCMARLMIHMDEWGKAHVFYSNYTWSQLRQLLAAILECCEDPHKHHQAVYEKYTDKRYKRASLFVSGKLATGFRLPIDNPMPKLDDSQRDSMTAPLNGFVR